MRRRTDAPARLDASSDGRRAPAARCDGPIRVAGAGRAAWRCRAVGRRGAGAGEGAALRASRSPRPASIRRRSPTSTRARVAAHIFEAPLHLRLPGAAGASMQAAHRRRRCPRSSADFATFTFRVRPGIYFADDPAFKGKPRELVAAGLRLLHQAPSTTRAGRARACSPLENDRHRRPARAAPAGDRRASKPFDYDTRGRGPARARPLHAPVQAAPSRGRASLRPVRRRRRHRRGGARGGRGLRRPDHGAPGRHRRRSGSPQWRRSSRIVLERNPSYRERFYDERAAGRRRRGRRRIAAALQGPAPADGRPRRGRDHRGGAAALAGVPQRRARRRSSACRPSSPTSAIPNGKLAPNLAKQGIQAYRVPARRRHAVVLRHGAPGGRRLHAGEGGAAPRDRAGATTSTRRSAPSARGQAIPAQSIVPPLT